MQEFGKFTTNRYFLKHHFKNLSQQNKLIKFKEKRWTFKKGGREGKFKKTSQRTVMSK